MGWLAIGSAASLGGILCQLFAPNYLGKIIDEIDKFRTEGAIDILTVRNFAIILAVLFAGASVFNAVKTLIMNNTVSRYYTCGLRIKISDKIRRLPVSYVDKTPSGEIISRMTGDVSQMGTTLHQFIDMIITGFLQLIAIAVMMYLINAVMASVVLAIVPVSVFAASMIARKSEGYFKTVQDKFGSLYSHIEESYGGYETVKGYGLEKRRLAGLKTINDEISKAHEKGGFLSDSVTPIISFTNAIGYAIVSLIGGLFAIRGRISVGEVVAVILFSKLLSGPLEGVTGAISVLQRTVASAKRVYEVLDTPEMTDSADTGAVLDGSGDVIFDGVHFSYDEKRPLFEGVNLNIESGHKVAIVGPTGAGKTTLVNLLMRFYDVQKGKITIGGKDICEVPREKVRETFSMVLQDTWLFQGTVYENVAYGKPGASKDEVRAACENAFADHFIKTLPNGYDTVIDEATDNLSGGQKQLLTIARAFLTDRDILILDEATSNVDTRTEVLIQRAMDKLMKGRTSFVIAHRLSTIVNSDLILVVDKGSLVEHGTHKELMEKKGFYYEIYQSQYEKIGG